ncbi:MAG: hypothetical protein JXR37_15240 [Kiritimatiellae bacterium]|nr:hypothetical protein [Kiritimatiellia bacterium]
MNGIRILTRTAGLLCLLAAARTSAKTALIIECEAFRKRVSEAGDYASSRFELGASGNRVLYRVFRPGYTLYEFNVPVAGRYAIWLRYASTGPRTLKYALGAQEPPVYQNTTVPKTGAAFTGAQNWGWARLATTALAKGTNTIALGNAPVHLDCLYVTDDLTEKPEANMFAGNLTTPLDEQTRNLIDRPIAEIRPDWLDGATDYDLPAWYARHRVHLHTRLSMGARRMQNPVYQDAFWHAAEHVKRMGAHVFVRHIKSGGEGAWWPSKVGVLHPDAQDRNVAREIIDSAHKQGLHIIVYHRHMEDEGAAEAHPDWICRDCRGEPYRKRGRKLCFNSPYADYFLTRALELIELGADGFYFDEVHMPRDCCWCRYCQAAFKQMTGLDHPTAPDPADPIWQKLKDFNNLTIERTFLRYRREFHKRRKDLVMLIGSNTWPGMGDRQMTGRLFRIADSQKTEFNMGFRTARRPLFAAPPDLVPYEPDVKIAMGYALARDATDGRPAHVWVPSLKTVPAAVHAAAGIMTHGNIANLDIAEETIPTSTLFNDALALGNRVSPSFFQALPLRWAVLHFSERARDACTSEPAKAHTRVLYPLYGAYRALLRAHLPVGFVTDSQLEEGVPAGCALLFVPERDTLTPNMQSAIATFERGGGTVVYQKDEWQWHTPAGLAPASRAFMAQIEHLAKATPVLAFGGPEKLHVVPFSRAPGTRLTVALANDFSWVDTRRADRTTNPQDYEALIAAQNTPPPPVQGVSVVIRNGTGKRPDTVTEMVSGRLLAVEQDGNDAIVRVPEFGAMAVLDVAY